MIFKNFPKSEQKVVNWWMIQNSCLKSKQIFRNRERLLWFMLTPILNLNFCTQTIIKCWKCFEWTTAHIKRIDRIYPRILSPRVEAILSSTQSSTVKTCFHKWTQFLIMQSKKKFLSEMLIRVWWIYTLHHNHQDCECLEIAFSLILDLFIDSLYCHSISCWVELEKSSGAEQLRWSAPNWMAINLRHSQYEWFPIDDRLVNRRSTAVVLFGLCCRVCKVLSAAMSWIFHWPLCSHKLSIKE